VFDYIEFRYWEGLRNSKLHRY